MNQFGGLGHHLLHLLSPGNNKDPHTCLLGGVGVGVGVVTIVTSGRVAVTDLEMALISAPEEAMEDES